MCEKRYCLIIRRSKSERGQYDDTYTNRRCRDRKIVLFNYAKVDFLEVRVKGTVTVEVRVLEARAVLE